ncbi:MAG: flavodoxin domain-containing protein [Oscillospiraceae bacterium]|nr:flavodoxin domain-containing protein [Oscillospiraceae bacterium]
MKILIAYAGKTGTTEKCAKLLEEKLNSTTNTTIINLDDQEADVSEYDFIIVGGSIRIGMLHGKAKKFINDNKDMLKTKKTAYYICCAFPDTAKEHFEKNISKELLDSSVTYDTFGGEMDISKQKGFSKFIVKMVSKTEEGKKEVRILNENIEKFAEKIK